MITKAADSGTRSTGNSQDGAIQRPAEAASKLEADHAGPIALVSSTDDKIQRELKPGHAGALAPDPPKCQVSSTNKGSASSDIPTLLDYAGVSSGISQPKVEVHSTVSSSRSAMDLAVKPVRKPSVVDLTSPPSVRTKPEETDTHNIAMEILKSIRQIPQVSRPHDTSQSVPKASTSNKPTSTESSNSGFLAQFKKYATSALSEAERHSLLQPTVSLLQDSKVATSPQSPSPSITKTEQSQKWAKGKAGEITPAAVSSSAHSVPPKQVSPNQRVSPQQEKAHSSERKQSPFTLLHQQLEQQQQQQQKQKPRQPDTAVRSKDPVPGKSQQSKSPQVSPVGGTDKAAYLSKEGKPTSHTHLLSQQIQQQIQQNYLSMLHKTHGVGQSKPPQPPTSAQAAKHQSLLAAAISNTGAVNEGSLSQGSAPRKAGAPPASRYSPQQAPAAATASASSSQDRTVNKGPARTSHSSSHPNQTLHNASLLSLKKKLISDTHTSHAAAAAPTSSSQIKRAGKPAAMAHALTAAQSQASMLASHSAAWSLLSFANSTTPPPTAHSSSALTNAALTSAFSPPLAHAQIQGSSRSSPNYPVSVLPGGKKTPSPTSSLHHQSRSPDNGRAGEYSQQIQP